MSRYHYQPYESSMSKRQYGELNSSFYIPPLEKFQGTTTTGDTYQGRIGNSFSMKTFLSSSIDSGHPARAYIPEGNAINQIGELDHTTNYRMDYPPHGVSLCAAKAYTIAQNKPVSAQ